ncbi:MAG: sulfur oxidation c-type cytochrome SoxX [Pseudomonadota bacterium]|nr:sulfur oxidation c-type cytochrome SoxX [Pseudomonadota bacterium]MDP1903569.1 sulfur oxidation c-type cytochrome SoxX [Pseudomonadota bacterium]MDP2351436.1 sulfur oxidation c-type cytochrome SoxX [Pseudomonadota bacterium]
MRKRASIITGVIATLLASSAYAVETGKDIAFNRSKGNCLACHSMPTLPDAEQPGESGPPLIAMLARFPDRAVLRAKIWDATATNSGSFMPPMGKHQVLTEAEIDKVVDFLYGL